uniref:peptidylglycine monooxygenase n=1 Tax=Tityus serrulatus TaxID=6887 RepID=A0A7S8RGB6_TITSE|nr:putative peptidyl-glycine alpha-hydroxylating monooxygenase [Tityus serrulatus]
MAKHLFVSILFLIQFTSLCFAKRKLEMLMPNVQPLHNETYLCTSFKMNKREHEYVVKFEPNATMHVAHHILIYGCIESGLVQRDTPRIVWNCGEMVGSKSEYVSAPICAQGSQVIYAWARDAPPLNLPQGVGFKVGKGSGINYLVLQVHYADVTRFLNGGTDNSGIILTLLPGSDSSVTKRAGVYLLGTGGGIPAKQREHMETACKIDKPIVLHPFAFRTHTHALGKVVSGYVIDRDSGKWKLIGKHDPLEPQMFYPVEDKRLIIQQGDVLAARCTMYNFRNRITLIGSTAEDEMCNFYMMYYVEGDEILDDKYCFSMGPPAYYWENDELIGDLPKWVDKDASTLQK